MMQVKSGQNTADQLMSDSNGWYSVLLVATPTDEFPISWMKIATEWHFIKL